MLPGPSLPFTHSTSVRCLRNLRSSSRLQDQTGELTQIARAIVSRFYAGAETTPPNRPIFQLQMPTVPKPYYALDLPPSFPLKNIPPVPSKSFLTDIQAAQLGDLCIQHTFTKHILRTRPHTSVLSIREYFKAVKEATKRALATNDTLVTEQVGRLSAYSETQCEDALLSCIEEDPRTWAMGTSFSFYFNQLAPDREEMDCDVVWKSSIPYGELELPQLEDPENFNPAYVMLDKELLRYTTITSFDRRFVKEKLDQLTGFGKLSFSYYASISVLRNQQPKPEEALNNVISSIVPLASLFVHFSGIKKTFVSYKGSVNDSGSSSDSDIFFRYLGLVEIENQLLIYQWVDHLVSISKNEPLDLSTFHKRFLDLVVNRACRLNLPAVTGKEFTDTPQLRELGAAFLDALASRIALSADPFHFLRIKDRVRSELLQVFQGNIAKTFDGDITSLIGYLSQDASELLSAASTAYPDYDPDNRLFNLKILTVNRRVPNMGSPEKEIFKKETYLPPVEDRSRVTRLLMVNNALVSSSRTDKSWSTDHVLKKTLQAHGAFGHSLFDYHCRKSLVEYFHDSHIDLIEPLYKIFTSLAFKRLALDSVGAFKYFDDKDYDRFISQGDSSLVVNAQFDQYVAILDLIDPSLVPKWTHKVASMFASVLKNLKMDDTEEFLKILHQEFRLAAFSLGEEMKEVRLLRVNPRLDSGIVVAKNSRLPKILETYLMYTLDQMFIGTKLPSFIDLREYLIEVVKKACSNPEIQARWMAAVGNENKFRKLLRKRIRRTAVPFDEDLPDLKVNMMEAPQAQEFYCWNQGLALPQVEPSALHKMLLVNFRQSMSFFSEIGARTSNPHTYSDICSKYGTLGGDFSNYLFAKHTKEIFGAEADAVYASLVDRRFMAKVVESSDILFHPFDLWLYTHKIEKSVTNDYYYLRYSAQTFRQYMGLLSHHCPEVACAWVKQIVQQLHDYSGSTLQKLYGLEKLLADRPPLREQW